MYVACTRDIQRNSYILRQRPAPQILSGRSDFKSVLQSYLAVMFAAMGLAQAQMDFPHVANAGGAVKRIFPLLWRKPAIDAANLVGLTPVQVS